MQSIVSSQQFDRTYLREIFEFADHLEKHRDTCLQGKILASLFYEPSTRTRFSFESAMFRLGGNILSTENAEEFSSVAKGETLEDSIRVIAGYSDIIVLRHFEIGSAEKAAKVSSVPIINAGDGAGQHPTQSLLDLYTVRRELGGVDGTRIAMVGDLKNGRTVRSLCYLLGKYSNIHITLVSPTQLKIGDDIKQYLDKHIVSYDESECLESVIGNVDVVYQTRIQKERFSSEAEYGKYKGRYILTSELVHRMKPHAIIMHPLPRVDEISPEVDVLPSAVYFKQAEYGLLVRMALIKMLLQE